MTAEYDLPDEGKPAEHGTPHAIGIDLGGTRLRAGAVDEAGRVHTFEVVESGTHTQPESLVRRIAELADRVRTVHAKAVGICIPGAIDRHAGVVLGIPVFPGWSGVPLARLLSAKLQLPVFIENDAKAAALGEWRAGAGVTCANMAYVTVSTGIGGGIIADGRLVRGLGGLAGEVGHVHIFTDTPVCACGRIGCWQAVASGTALDEKVCAAIAREPTSVLARLARGQPPSARLLAEAAAGADAEALRLLDEEARLLGIGFANLHHLYSPERIVMGGGVAALLPWMRKTIEQTIVARLLAGFPPAQLIAAALGDSAGVVGAAGLALDAVSE